MREKLINVDKMKECVKAPLANTMKEEEAWRWYDITNCYSYAIGMFVDIEFLKPGEISKMELKKQYTDEDILERVIGDLEALGLETSISSLEEPIEDNDSWKIAIMNTGPKDIHELYHKRPYEQFPSNYDSRHRAIDNPETATFAFSYHLVAYLVVRLQDKTTN